MERAHTFGNSWLSPLQIRQISHIAACNALIDAHHPGDCMAIPEINYNFTDHHEASMTVWANMFRSPERDWNEVIIDHTDYFVGEVSVTPDFINHFHSLDTLECFFYRRFAEKESGFSKAMPHVAKASSAVTGLALLGICIKHCIDGHLHPVQALSIMGMIALPAIIAAKEYKKNPKPDNLRMHFSDDVILESIKSEYKYLKTTPNHANHVLANRLLKELDEYRPEKRFTDDGIEVYKPENHKRIRPR